jgi:dihydroorotase-like cyclic amidohydrolase
MAEYDLLVLNGLVVTHDKTAELDIAVKDGKIAELLFRGKLEGVKARKVIDAQGGMVMVSYICHSTCSLLTCNSLVVWMHMCKK